MWLKAGYGSAEIGFTAVEVMLQVYLLELYVSAGLNPFWAGLALAIAVVWDAVSDPLMGVISDRRDASSARGKRLPFVILGVPLSVVAFVLLFSPEPGAGDQALFLRLLCLYLVLNTTMTLVIVPYLSLINDLASSSEDRSEFFGWRLVFSGAGLIAGLSVPALIAYRSGVDLEAGDASAIAANRSEGAEWIGATFLLSAAIALAVIWKRAGESKAHLTGGKRFGLWEVLKSAGRSRSFLFLVGAFVSISMGRAVNASLALIFYKGTLSLSEEQVSLALIGLSLTVMAATPLWVALSKRYGKRGLCVLGSLLLSILTAVVYPLMPPEAMGPVIFIIVTGGIAASSVVLLESLFSDVVEEDGAKAKTSLTGSYYGLWRMSTKLARAGGLAISGVFLGIIGYQEGTVSQSDTVYRSVAWVFGPGVALFFFGGTFLLWRETERSKKTNTYA